MKVTVDTRHDSLEEALATVHAAFGSSTAQPAPAAVATEPATRPPAMRHVAKRAGSRKGAAARPGTKRSPAKKAATKAIPRPLCTCRGCVFGPCQPDPRRRATRGNL